MVIRSPSSAFVADAATKLEAARQRHGGHVFLGTVTAYCEDSACPVREIELTVKEHDHATPDALACPACGRPLRVLAVLTRAERDAEAEAHARRSVTLQRRHQQHPGAPVPLGVLLDELAP